jgi:hypothetical protein
MINIKAFWPLFVIISGAGIWCIWQEAKREWEKNPEAGNTH